MRRQDQLHTFHRFQTTLRLTGFGGFISEAIHVILHLTQRVAAFHTSIVVVITPMPLDFKVRITAGIFIQLVIFDMNDAINDAIEKITIVRDQDQCTAVRT